MTTETIVYANETDWRTALNSIRIGWKIIGNSKQRLDIIWTDDAEPPPTAEEIKIKELKDKLKDDTMTHKELLELLRLTGIV